MQVAEISTANQAGKYGPLKGQCCVKPGSYIKGTFFLGGAGMDGIYIPKLIGAFHKSGIKSAVYLDREKWSEEQYTDAFVGVFLEETMIHRSQCYFEHIQVHINNLI